MKKFIILLLSLVILIIAELAFFTTISPVCQKEVVFSDAQNNKIDFENLENKYDSSLPGLTTSFLEVTNDNVNELKKYSYIGTLILKDISFDTYSQLNEIRVYQLNAENVSNFDISIIDKTRLQSLSLNNTTLKQSSDLKHYKDLKYLYLKNLSINLDFITDAHSLLTFSSISCDIKDYSTIGKLTELTTLQISDCDIDDVSWISNCNKLEFIDVNRTNISDVAFIKKLNTLSSITLNRNKLSGFFDLSDFDDLKYLDISHNKINAVEIENIENMSFINLSYNHIDNLSENIIKQAEIIKDKDITPSINVFCNPLKNNDKLSNKVFKFRNEKGIEFSCEEHQKYISKVKNIISENVDMNWSDAEKAIALFNYIKNNAEYDHELPENDPPPFNHISHTEYGALINKVAVCDGFSYAYRDLLHQVGVDAIVYHGDWSSTTDGSSHAWSLVKIDGKYYHCDLTWEVGLAGYVEELRNFGMSDKTMLDKSYILLDKSAPKCLSDMDETMINNTLIKVKSFRKTGE